MTLCPCGSGNETSACCGPLLAGAAAPTALALMRSRYAAFVAGDIDYLESTHVPEIRDEFNRTAAETMAREAEWLGLEVRDVVGGDAMDETGTVEFIVRFRRNGQEYLHHEEASFRRQDGRWMYVDGRINPKSAPVRVAKVGRNDPCPCGSGRKYKKCCGA